MTETQALNLQKWCYANLKLNLVLKEQEGDNWFVTIGLPNGDRERLDQGYVRMAVAYDPSTSSPHAANLGLMGADMEPYFKRGPEGTLHLLDVPVACLKGETSPVVYETHEGFPVLVF